MQYDAKFHTFDISTPLDMTKALEFNGMNEKIYYTILVNFIKDQLVMCLKNMTLAHDKQNWKKFKEAAHNLKNSSGYCGAGRVHYDCYFI